MCINEKLIKYKIIQIIDNILLLLNNILSNLVFLVNLYSMPKKPIWINIFIIVLKILNKINKNIDFITIFHSLYNNFTNIIYEINT